MVSRPLGQVRSGTMELYDLVGPLVRLFPAEAAHGIVVRALRAGIVPKRRALQDPRLEQELWGLRFPNPVGLAAGFDKNAEVFGAMLDQGFGFVEIGSVTPKAQPGNPKPRMFRYPQERAVLNRLGFNNRGVEFAARQLEGRDRRAGVVGVNLGKNKTSDDAPADYGAGAATLGPLADYLVVNVSSPNTPGLRALQERDALERILEVVRAAAPNVPVLLKIAPDLADEDLADICDLAQGDRVEGLIVSNTTVTRPGGLGEGETGGLSGAPLFEISTRVLRDVHRATKGAVPLVGVGGICDAGDAYAKVLAGASLLQLYSALVYTGTRLVTDIQSGLLERLGSDGFEHLRDAVGAGAS